MNKEQKLLNRIAELEAQLAVVQQGVPAARSGRKVLVDSGALQMALNALERDALEGKLVRAEMRVELIQSITHPTQAAKGDAMKHTSTEQPEALRLADAVRTHDEHPRVHFYNRVAAELRRLHARVQELEASQAQRGPLDVSTIAKIAESFEAVDPTASFWVEVCRAFESAFVAGITQEKQG